MRYVKGHGLQTRSRIVEEASYGLRQRGADGMSVADPDEARRPYPWRLLRVSNRVMRFVI